MNKDLVEITHHQTFESLREEEDGCEFWSARKLSKALEYNDYRNFLNVIEKAKEACINSRHDIEDHFVDVTDMIEIGKGGQRQAADVRLSRYACYLVVQNGDPTKPVIANGQTYFSNRDMKRYSSSLAPKACARVSPVLAILMAPSVSFIAILSCASK